jgi:hypothetical protein
VHARYDSYLTYPGPLSYAIVCRRIYHSPWPSRSRPWSEPPLRLPRGAFDIGPCGTRTDTAIVGTTDVLTASDTKNNIVLTELRTA